MPNAPHESSGAHTRARQFRTRRHFAGLLAAGMLAAAPQPAAAQQRGPLELATAAVAGAALRIAYGTDSLQFGELRLPHGAGPHPVAILVHGGCWVAQLGSLDPRAVAHDNISPLAAALADAGDVDEWTDYAAAVRGDAESALARAAAFDAARPWPETRLLRVFHELRDHERRRQLAARIDTHPAGAAMLLRELSLTGAALTFDPADTPNFLARMREAGVDPNNLRVMPRLNAAAEVVR
jgi:hypothetical protein